MPWRLESKFAPAGDQPKAIQEITERLDNGCNRQVLLGITGSGKTYTVANIIQEINKPALVLAHNKTLAGQLCNEFKEFFPDNKVEYFISYYDYYQPESYIPSSDTFIEKTAKVNDNIDRLRYSTTRGIYERDDVLVVASVSCIYGLGTPELYFKSAIPLALGMEIDQKEFLKNLVEIQYGRNDTELLRGLFRVRGEIVDIWQADEEKILRIEFFGDEIERLSLVDHVTGEILELLDEVKVFPAKHYMTDDDLVEEAVAQIEKELHDRVNDLRSQGKDFEAQRIQQRTKYDLEMIKEMGYCSGIENYSRIFERRKPGSAPQVLIDYYNRRYGEDGWVCYIDESHMTLPQLKAMYNGDRSRKQVLVDYGFRLPCALDNRPLKYDEFTERVKNIVYISATPGDEEIETCGEDVTELIIRPTGLIDPELEIIPTKGQIDVLMEAAQGKIVKGEKVIINTLTKKMAEDLSDYLLDHDVRARYLHSEIKALERIEILRALRMNEFDVLVGVNLLREGIDLPEVSLVCIMDADKEGYLRNYRTLIQMIGRAARNANSKVLLFADKMTASMEKAISETERRRKIQVDYNTEHGIVPKTILKSTANPILDIFAAERVEDVLASRIDKRDIDPKSGKVSKKQLVRAIDKLEGEMKDAAKNLDFEQAAEFRDQLKLLREKLEEKV
ncbi:MAG: excinuclease ABC subunit UvrB [Candidatus Caenarcaniphilales bacterium]|nr:excinuclease ABC subunit UvrB [Candidatus Caenarcaniphilales bacterium]